MRQRRATVRSSVAIVVTALLLVNTQAVHCFTETNNSILSSLRKRSVKRLTQINPTRAGRPQRSTELLMKSSQAASSRAVSNADSSNLLVGKLASNLSKLFAINPDSVKAIKLAVSQTVVGWEVGLIAFFGWALLPILRFIYGKCRPEGTSFERTYYYKIPHLIGQFAQIGGVVYAVDVLTVVLGVLGFSIPNGFNVCNAKILYLLWGAYRLAKFKKHLLIEKRGKAGVTNKVLNVFIAVISALGVLDILSVNTGLAVQSLFTLGGAGTLIVSLGSQNLATQIVNGLAIASTGKFYEGEKIVVGDERVVGTVEKMSLMATDIRGNDETVMNIPNQQLAGQRVGNLSRSKRSSVIQTVCFSYDDIEKIPQICTGIKAFIKERCPTLETDIRPFRVTLRDAKSRGLEVGIESYYRLPPFSNAYYENLQNVMFAVADAARKNGVQFNMPTVTVEAATVRIEP